MRILVLAAKEWRLLLRNPHALATLFAMPALFVLVMSFTLKNTLVAHVEMPLTGIVVEDTGKAAAQWAREWLARPGVRSLSSRAALRSALEARTVEAGVIVRSPFLG